MTVVDEYEALFDIVRDRSGGAWDIVYRDDLPRDMYGGTDYISRCIVMRRGLTEAEWRCTLIHELLHVERGLAARGSRAVEEAVVDLMATARIMQPEDLPGLATRVEAEGIEAVADSLGVDAYTISTALVLAKAVTELLRD